MKPQLSYTNKLGKAGVASMWFNVSKALRFTEKFVEHKVNSSLLCSLKTLLLGQILLWVTLDVRAQTRADLHAEWPVKLTDINII